MHILSLVGPIFQQVAGATFELAANGLQGRKPHRLGFARLQDRQVGKGDAHPLAQLAQRHLAPSQHHIKVYYYHRYLLPQLNCQFAILGHLYPSAVDQRHTHQSQHHKHIARRYSPIAHAAENVHISVAPRVSNAGQNGPPQQFNVGSHKDAPATPAHVAHKGHKHTKQGYNRGSTQGYNARFERPKLAPIHSWLPLSGHNVPGLHTHANSVENHHTKGHYQHQGRQNFCCSFHNLIPLNDKCLLFYDTKVV